MFSAAFFISFNNHDQLKLIIGSLILRINLLESAIAGFAKLLDRKVINSLRLNIL